MLTELPPVNHRARQLDAPTVATALAWATAILEHAHVLSPRLDAEVLLAHVLQWKRAKLYARPEYELSASEREAFAAAVERRFRREPVPYIIGHREFFGLDFLVDRRVLIPRPETELLVERALEVAVRSEMGKGKPILADIGTGSGIVAISLALSLPGAMVYATDSSAPALQVAAENLARYGLATRVRLLEGELLEPLPEPVHMIVANLPYVRTQDLALAAPDVIEYEPLIALDGGADGLAHIRRLLAEAVKYLRAEGSIVLEIGAGQGEEAVSLARRSYPKAQVELFRDYAGHDRVVRVQM